MSLSWSSPPRVVAHRGASAEAPENTMAAFARAVAATPAFELDVHLAADGVPVVVHDAQLARTTGRAARVGALPSAEVARLDAGAWFGPDFAGERVPTLEAVLLAYGPRALVNVETKDLDGPYPGLGEAVGRLTLRLGLRDRVLVTTFDPAAAKAFKVSFPEIRAGVILPYAPEGAEVERLAAFADALAVHHASVRGDVVAAARRHGLLLLAWTVDDPEEALRLARLGVDCVVTNDPARVAKVLA